MVMDSDEFDKEKSTIKRSAIPPVKLVVPAPVVSDDGEI
jgi:hypothetical protein